MSDSPSREWRFYLDDMILFAERVIHYTEGLDQSTFGSSGLHYDATLRNLELIGEAATHVPDAVCQANPQIPWRLICRYPQPADPRLSGHRQRYPLEHRQGRYSNLLPQLKTFKDTVTP